MYTPDFRQDLLPVIEESSLVHPWAKLNSNGLDELSDTDSASERSGNPDLDQDANDSGVETSENDEEDDSIEHHGVKNKRGSTKTTSDDVNDSDVELLDAPPQKCSKTKKPAKYTSIRVGNRVGRVGQWPLYRPDTTISGIGASQVRPDTIQVVRISSSVRSRTTIRACMSGTDRDLPDFD